MSGLLKRAMDLQHRPEHSGSAGAKYAPSMEIEEFGENSPLKISRDFYGKSAVPSPAGSLASDIEKITDNIELPAALLEVIRNHWNFPGGALFFWDKEENVYVPWASEGLDKTTIRRMRLSEEFLKKEKTGLPKSYTGKDLEKFRPFFSVRLFDQLENLVLAALDQSDGRPALFLMINLEKEPDRPFLTLMKTSLGAAERKLSSSRILQMTARAEQEEVLGQEELYAEIDRQIEKILEQDKKLTMIILGLDNVLAFLDKKNSSLDPFRVKQDVLAILESMFSGIGSIYNLEGNRIILLLSSKTAVREELVLNQIHLSLQSFFQHQEDFPPLDAKIRKIPEDGVDSASLLDNLA